MKQYIDALTEILETGRDRTDRTEIGTRGIFGYQMRFDLRTHFPAVTTKKLAWKSVVSELLWFLEGSTDERRLAEILFEKPREELVDKKTIWTANADKQAKDLGYKNTELEKDLGPVYGHQWRQWDAKMGYVDQIAQVLESLKFDPYSRRHIVSAWNADQIHVMALPPCHTMFQFYVTDLTFDERMNIMQQRYPTVGANTNGYFDKEQMLDRYDIPKLELSCQLYQRSADMFLGVPFNIASYSLLTHMMAQLLNYSVGDFIHTIGDAHIYQNHFDQVKEQISRTPLEMPTLQMPKFTTISELLTTKTSDYILLNYNPMSSIKAEMAV